MKRISLIFLTLFGVSFVYWLGLGLPGHAASPHVVKRGQMHMGTLVFLTAVAPDKRLAHDAIEQGFAEIHRLEQILSTWIPDSKLSRINAAAGQRAVEVGPETMELLGHSLEMARLTEGGFNVAIGPAVEAWNVSREGRIPTREELEATRPLMDLSAIHIDQMAGTVYLARSGMRVDIGGIGKGYAADFAARVMREAGASAGVVAISGDIKTFGRLPDGQRFVFGIQHPRKENGITIVTITFSTLQPARLSQSNSNSKMRPFPRQVIINDISRKTAFAIITFSILKRFSRLVSLRVWNHRGPNRGAGRWPRYRHLRHGSGKRDGIA